MAKPTVKALSSAELRKVQSDELWKLGGIRLATPVGELKWPHLGKPKQENPKYDGPHGKYRIDYVFDPKTPEGKAFLARATAAHNAMIDQAKRWAEETGADVLRYNDLNFKAETTKVDGERVPTGKLVVPFTKNAKRKTKNGLVETPILVKDTAKNVIPANVLLTMAFTGSQGRIGFDLKAYFMNNQVGTSVSIQLLQVTDFVAMGAGSANEDDYFDEELSGFVLSEESDDDFGETQIETEAGQVNDDF